MKTTESGVRQMLEAMGKATSDTPRERIEAKVKNLEKTLKDANDLEGDNLALLKRLAEAQANGEEVEIDWDVSRPPEKRGPKPKKKAEKQQTKTGRPKGAKKEKSEKPKIERDAFGNRQGTQSAQINAALGKKPRTFEQIVDTVGLPKDRVRNHLKWLESKDWVERSDKGYALKARQKDASQ